jgi:hypothetical protein
MVNVKDFKKKKAKVGKTLKKENVTKIDIKSKKIFLSSQSSIMQGTLTPNQYLDKQLQLLHHQTASSRKAALDTIGEITLNHTPIVEARFSIILPMILELLLDEESSVRTATLQLVTNFCGRILHDSFAVCSSIIVVYIHAGLTNLIRVSYSKIISCMQYF